MSNINEFEDLNDVEETVTVIDEDGNKLEFIIVDSAVLNGINYLLVIESEFADKDECDAVILKEVSSEDDDSIFQIVEDDEEFDKVARIFEENTDQYEIEI